jgi:hypothetical protein
MKKMIRTTLTLPQEVHHQLRTEAVEKHLSFNDLLLQKLGIKEESETQSTAEKIAEAHTFFHKMGKVLGPIDSVRLIREERDRNND